MVVLVKGALILFLSFLPLLSFTQDTQLLSSRSEIEALKTSCVLRISFGSYGTGVSREQVDKTMKILDREKESLLEIKKWNWGLEGEFDLCPIFKTEATAGRVHELLKEMTPEFSKKGPTTLYFKGRQTKKTVWPEKGL